MPCLSPLRGPDDGANPPGPFAAPFWSGEGLQCTMHSKGGTQSKPFTLNFARSFQFSLEWQGVQFLPGLAGSSLVKGGLRVMPCELLETTFKNRILIYAPRGQCSQGGALW